MSIGLRTNVAALNAITRLDRIGRDLSSVYNHLSSGLRITSASDDAAGLSIASSLKADSRVYAQGIRNVNDGASVLNVAEGAMQQLSSITIRQRELAEQAANGVYSSKQRQALQAESNALTREYNRIVRSTVFGGNNVIDGVGDSFRLQQGYGLVESTLLNIGQALGFAAGDGTFTAPTTIAVAGGFFPNSAATGDINGDGIADIVTIESGLIAQIQLGNGDGTFSYSTAYVSIPSLTGQDPRLLDINNDGNLDLVMGGTNRLTIALGNGNGTFKVANTVSSSPLGAEFTTGDFNGDGFLDVVGVSGSTANLYFGNGDGTFNARISITQATAVNSIVATDFNNDGLTDFFVSPSGGGSNTGFVRLSNGDGTFSVGQTITLGAWLGNLGSLDANNDGAMDIVGINAVGQVEVMLGNRNGTFKYRTQIDAAGNLTSLKIGDLNGDGILDIVAYDGNWAGILTGNSDGTFAYHSQVISNGADLDLADFNGDGVLDILTSGSGLSEINILIGNQDSSGRRNNVTYNLDLSNIIGARAALVQTHATLTRINQELGNLGALQSRLSTSLNNLAVRRQNYEGAASQILDVDVADKSAKLNSKRILQQAATAVLSQANRQPGIALRLLGNIR